MIMLTLDDVRRALALNDFDPLNAQARMAPHGALHAPVPSPPREAGVLLLVLPAAGQDGREGLHLVLTRRSESLRGHRGQISFPGGKRDPNDSDFIMTALRETWEELGICQHSVEVVGQLSPFYIPPSNFNVYPAVGILPETPPLTPNPNEVAEVLFFALRDLLDPAFKHQETRILNGQRFNVPYYQVQGHKVWGATAVMLSEFEQRLRTVRS